MKKMISISALILSIFSAHYSAAATRAQERQEKPNSVLTVNKNVWKGRWHEIKGNIKKNWAKLTDDDLLEIEGEQERLAGIVQKRYGLDEERAKHQVREYYSHLSENLSYDKAHKDQSFYSLNDTSWHERWPEIRTYLKEKWPKLTQSDVMLLENHQEKIQPVIQKRYKISDKESRKQINEFYTHLSEAL